MKKIVVSSCLGNILQVYDVAIYAFFAPIIAPLFFPHQHHLSALLSVFVIFFVGFLAKPIGALVLGRLGDTKGRKYALVIAMWLMAAASFCIGILPTYATLGITAALFLAVLRFLQGFSSGGEIAGSAVFLVEHAPEKRRGLWGSYSPLGMNLGALVAALVCGFLSATLPKTILHTWGWRIPYFITTLGGLVGVYLRIQVPETNTYQQLEQQKTIENHPLRTLIKQHKKRLLKICLLSWLAVAGVYLIFAYNVSLLKAILHYSLPHSMAITIFLILTAVISMPIAGRLSDSIGRKGVLLIASLCLAIGAPLYYVTANQHHFIDTLFASLFVSIPFGSYLGVAYVLMTETMPNNIRFSGVTLAYNLSDAIFGGTAPVLMTWLIALTHNKYMPAIYLSSIAIATFMFIVFLSKKASSHYA